MSPAPLRLSRSRILAFRRRVGALDERLPAGRRSLRTAAWAGLQDSMPRAALLSIHARVARTTPTSWEDPALVQIWGPRFAAYVVAARDLAVFTLGRLPEVARGLRVAEDLAARLGSLLGDGTRMTYGEAGRALGVDPNKLRYAAATGTVLMRWDGARQPVIRVAPRPEVDPGQARLELARRFLHVFGPSTAASFVRWAGISARSGASAFGALDRTPVRTPIGDAWILASDEPAMRADPRPAAAVRLLPSGDAFLLGDDRALVVPDAARRAELWTPRVWPGGLLLDGDVAGTWRRAEDAMTIRPWRRLSRTTREAVEAEAASLPLPDLPRGASVTWDT